jgi:hypothetical protein
MQGRSGATTTSPCETPATPAGAGAPRERLSALQASLPFAACYVYAPHGLGAVSLQSRLLCRRVKTADPQWLPRYAGVVAELSRCGTAFGGLFPAGSVLVPVPGSAHTGASTWAAAQLAAALRGLGLAAGVWQGLARCLRVPASAAAPVGRRPTVYEHYASFVVRALPRPLPKRIVLIDDVISRGRTGFAAALRLRGVLPHADIRLFALIRTLGFESRLAALLAPCEGYVRWAGGDARREP